MKKYLIIFMMIFMTSAHANNFQLKVQPLPYIIGAVNAELGLGLGNLVLGVGGMKLDLTLGSVEFAITEVHGRVDYMFNGAFSQGLYLSAVASQISLALTETDLFSAETLTGEVSATGLLFGLGYRWQWPSFFMDLGYMAGTYTYDQEKLELKDSSGTVQDTTDAPSSIPTQGIEFNLGWAF